MKCISSVLEAYGDRCVYEVEESEITMQPYYSGPGREPELREAAVVGCYANGQPKYDFIRRDPVTGKATVEAFHSIGD